MEDTKIYLEATEAIRNIRSGLQADHSDLEILGYDASEALMKMRLILTEDTECWECVMPKTYLIQMILADIRERLPFVKRIVLDDPRETVSS